MREQQSRGRNTEPVNQDPEEYGDFEEIADEGSASEKVGAQNASEAPVRVRMPRNTELVGVVVQRLGGNKMEIKATDGKTRNCRVPGRYRRTMWLRPGNFVLIQPWPDDNSRADVIFQYKPNHVSQLRKRGLLKDLQYGF